LFNLGAALACDLGKEVGLESDSSRFAVACFSSTGRWSRLDFCLKVGVELRLETVCGWARHVSQ
jgi:hypothetical protein